MQEKSGRPLMLDFSNVVLPALFATPQTLGGNWTAVGSALRESHPTEDFSELPPLRETVAGQGYHCRQMRSLRNSTPRLLLDRREPLCTLHFPTLTAGNSAAGGLGASSASLSFSEGSSTDVIQMPGITSNGVFLKVQASGV